MTNEISAVGSLLAEESVIIRPEIDGRLLDLHFQEGQAVPRGAKLVTLDASEVQARSWRRPRRRCAPTSSGWSAPRSCWTRSSSARTPYDVAKNNYERSIAVKEEIDARLSKTVIHAPFPGIVGLRLVSPGAYLKKGDDVVRLDNIGSIKLDFRVPEGYVSQVKVGQQVAIKLDAFPNEIFTGRIYAMEPVVDERTRTVLLRARVNNTGLQAQAGHVRAGRADAGHA